MPGATASRRCAPPSSLNCGAHDGNRTHDLFLTKEVLYRLSYVGILYILVYFSLNSPAAALELARVCAAMATWRLSRSIYPISLERETGLEPATPSLEGSRSTN